jgi:hypothetical protein
MGLFASPLAYAGYPPEYPTVRNAITRAATESEAADGTLDNVYISPATAQQATALDFASPPVAGYGSTTPRPVASTTLTSTGATTLASGAGVAAKLGNSTGTLGFFGATGATRVTQAAVTNSVTTGGTTNTLSDYSDLSVYATDAAAIHGNFYQIGQILNNVVGALRSYGMLA